MDSENQSIPRRGFLADRQLLRQLLQDWRDEAVGNKGQSIRLLFREPHAHVRSADFLQYRATTQDDQRVHHCQL